MPPTHTDVDNIVINNMNNNEEDLIPAAVVNLKLYSTSKPNYMDSHFSVQPNCAEHNIIERVDF